MGMWPLVGREEELARVEAAIRRGRGVLVAGPAGAGKTRLLNAVVEAAEKRGDAVVSVVASRASASIPLGCMAALLGSEQESAAEAASLVRVRNRIAAIADGATVVMALDDAQWLDGASAVLVHQLVAGGEVIAVASVRTDEAVPHAVTTLWKDALLERIDLAPLGSNAVVALLERVLGGQVQRRSALRLAQRCRGNALFLRELLDEATRLELVRHQDGVWVIDDPPARSARLAELVADRLGDLDAAPREALELVALGEPVGLDVLAGLTGMAAVETLDQRGLVVIAVDGRRHEVRLDHPVHGDVVRAQMPELRRRRLLKSLADELESHGLRRRGDPTRIAVLQLDAGIDPDPEMVLAAAREACTGAGWPMAERLARAAYRANPTLGTAELLASVLFETGKYDEQQTILEEASAFVSSDADRALVANVRAGGLFWGLGDKAGMHAVLVDAEAKVTDLNARWEIRSTRAVFESQSGDPHTALALLEGCPDPGSELGLRAHAQIALARAFALSALGRGSEALTMIEEAIARREAEAPLLSVYGAGLLEAAQSGVLVGLGRLAEANVVATKGYEHALRAGETGALGLFELALSRVALHRGQLADALRHSRDGTVALREVRHRGGTRWGLASTILAAALARDREVAAYAQQALEELGPHPAGVFDVLDERALAWAAIANDDPATARRHLAAAIELARTRNLPGEEAGCLHDKVRIGDAAEVADRLTELAGHCDGDLVPTMAKHAAGVVAGDVDMLEDAAEQFAKMGFLLKAAEAAMGASESAARAGDQRRATRLAQRATELAGRCQTPATPLLASPGGPVPLTNREREVALLAAAGLPSREIGERLYLSARTVDNHLARVYTKLGVTRRADLAAALG